MDRDEFYKLGLASGWLAVPEGANALSADERKIALSAIASRATGSPANAAVEILAGKAVLDGRHLPILVWGTDVTREEKAAWHKSEAAFWDASALRFAELTKPPARGSEQEAELSESPSTACEAHLVDSRQFKDSEVVSPGLLEADEQGRKAFYDAMVKNGVYQSENSSTSGRNQRDQK
ncbi:hypothetical protein [Pseudomonas syringae group sp. J309-1]|uniref:hypothetical protein n=1 Tax=Pseudomonas syringae group sp. J309-1 TaxID=3079588 RepID=UPI00290C42DC|nr:hypothetical protein [Pseudomonas syringae group sp. J309-1]MDU8358014.1 hypothetical protein [Pseudomonas syringae group sp. J309-1]